MKFLRLLNLILLAFLIIICLLGLFYKHISFGMGLGDIIGYFVLISGTILYVYLFQKYYKEGIAPQILMLNFYFIFTFLVVLKATYLRSDEYRWNGCLFYERCLGDFNISNNNYYEIERMSICPCAYSSDFTGKWNGKYIELLSGDIKYPDELKEHIKSPITIVFIKMEEEEIREPLQLHQVYSFSGTIHEIKNEIPIMNVSLN
ncbi:hypothetical protein KMW28_24695 [Flammeovirga yaeyamensis]|uniref:Uncharacterized protein n=1 Tax=Flammeovirga yaeyamensis TaxID=367791 RepID=A0AAX1N963_9BACT|nr:hypothetical protein [Flammeovirga yaeyamensis]MBB3699513.1 hypothetical protein [Flammeovirga yaeyamensis]NMF35231.1 hypothetical protein [Flammeovirga yaeyamensis]QWG04093.1 hypothetical protein KMW28_24695 [Flammeovirga yaeyamensis]